MHVICSFLPKWVTIKFTIGPRFTINYQVTTASLSVPFSGFHFDTEDGDKVLPGFLDSIIGIQQGETRSFPLAFPESWRQEHLRGVQAQFTVSFLFRKIIPSFSMVN